jgi:SAM-dependent methyltransferase
VKLLRTVDIDHRHFTFVDFGSGKGRAVLLASELPFRKVVGVEFSPELDRVARENLANFRSDQRQCAEVELVCGDALEYPLPDGPCVLYFYNPFGKEVMAGVVERVVRSFGENPREIYVLYANPTQATVWERAGCFRKLAAPENATVYRAEPPAGTAAPDDLPTAA